MARAPDAIAEQLVAIYRRAHARVQAQVAAAVQSGALGTEAQRRRQLQAIRVILARLTRESNLLLPTAVADPYSKAAVAVDTVHGLSDRFGFAGVHEQAVEVGIAALHSRLTVAIGTVGRTVDDVFRQVQLEQAAIAIAAGDRREDATSGMVADLRAHGVTAFHDVLGRRWSLERYATMAIRTNTREMVTVGTTNRLIEQGMDLVTISTHRGSCPICIPYQGRTYSLTGEHTGYPRATILTPFHPNCRHVTTPAAATFDEFEKALMAAEPVAPPVRLASQARREWGQEAGDVHMPVRGF